jgi:hypothetical protein
MLVGTDARGLVDGRLDRRVVFGEGQPVRPLAQVADLFVNRLRRGLDRDLARDVVLAVKHEQPQTKNRDDGHEEH